jgi:hypothetical protein
LDKQREREKKETRARKQERRQKREGKKVPLNINEILEFFYFQTTKNKNKEI